MSLASPARSIARPLAAPHIVDVLIAERAPKLAATPVWPVLRPLLYQILDYGKAVRMADAISPLPGGAALDYVSDLLALKVAATGLDHARRNPCRFPQPTTRATLCRSSPRRRCGR